MQWPSTIAPVQLGKELVQRKALPVTAVPLVSFWGANSHAVAQHCCTSAAWKRVGAEKSLACDCSPPCEFLGCKQPCSGPTLLHQCSFAELLQKKALLVTAVSPVSFWGANSHAVAQHCCTSAALKRVGAEKSLACDCSLTCEFLW